MNRIRTKLIGLALLALVASLPFIAYEVSAGDSFGTGFEAARGHRHGEPVDALASRLDLSKEQIAKLRDLRERHVSETTPIREELIEKRLEMRKLFTDPSKDEATILATQREIESLQQKLHEKIIQFRLEQRRILTPEQLRQLNEITNQFDREKCWG